MRRSVVPLAVAAALLLPFGSPASAAPPVLTQPVPARVTVTWTAPEALPLTGAGVQLFAVPTDGRPARLLGFAHRSDDGRTYSLSVPAGTMQGARLEARAAGRRLDGGPTSITAAATGTARSSSSAPAPVEKAAYADVDPGAPGKYATRSVDYTLPSVTLPGLPHPVEMLGHVVAPKGALGNRPLVLILHGRHGTCYIPRASGPGDSEVDADWPCPAPEKAIPSYLGYLKAQKLLASQGYVTVSISANGINAQDGELADGGAQARSSLLRLHLAQWADWQADPDSRPAGLASVPPVNLQKVLLAGHSRGGEGANRAALDSLNPPPADVDGYHGAVRWKVLGTYLLAPTAFGADPAADVPSVVVLPGCDGDVYDQQGQQYVDGSRATSTGTALHSAVRITGADHNFFNSEWTPGRSVAESNDDWWLPKDTYCGTSKKVAKTSLRLSGTTQEQVGAVYLATAARLFVAGDDRARPILDGSKVIPKSLKGLRVSASALGLRRTSLARPAKGLTISRTGSVKASVCYQVAGGGSGGCLPGGGDSSLSPNFVPFVYGARDPDRFALRASWTKASGRVLVPVTGAGGGTTADLSHSSSVALRVIVPPNSTSTSFDVAVRDSKGHRAVLGTLKPKGLPGTANTVSYWAQERRVPLAEPGKVDLTKVSRLEFVPRSKTGKLWLLDAWGRKAGTPAVRQAPLTRVDVGDAGKVAEGSTEHTVDVPVTLTGTTPGTVRVFVTDSATGVVKASLLQVAGDGAAGSVPWKVLGDDLFAPDGLITVQARAGAGTVVGGWSGGVTITNDDPVPTLSFTPVKTTVTEGATLRWKVATSAPAAVDLQIGLQFVDPPQTPAMTTYDVSGTWLSDTFFDAQKPYRRLSKVDGTAALFVAAGDTSVDVTVPTAKDPRVEGTEYLRLHAFVVPMYGNEGIDDPTDPANGVMLDGTVVDG
ncbi:alpha/beta hydrolase family protein [Spongisporangium articulatum]|uniref:Alpha/beta hydrolase family protein n=1 Tax=Spongisporangium articulatum TaxID=3362603 RepID=A0ABW8AQN1_9ACTN